MHLVNSYIKIQYPCQCYIAKHEIDLSQTTRVQHNIDAILSKLSSRVQWFWLFFTFWGITTHPWHPKGPRVWKLAKKKFQLHPWPAEIFGKNRKMRFFGTISKFNFSSPVRQIFTIFLAWFIYGILNTHTKFYVSKSKTVVTREWSRQCSKYICLQSLESKF